MQQQRIIHAGKRAWYLWQVLNLTQNQSQAAWAAALDCEHTAASKWKAREHLSTKVISLTCDAIGITEMDFFNPEFHPGPGVSNYTPPQPEALTRDRILKAWEDLGGLIASLPETL